MNCADGLNVLLAWLLAAIPVRAATIATGDCEPGIPDPPQCNLSIDQGCASVCPPQEPGDLQICAVGELEFSTTDWGANPFAPGAQAPPVSVSVQRFNPNLGELKSITISLSASTCATIGLENNAPIRNVVTTTLAAEFGLSHPLMGPFGCGPGTAPIRELTVLDPVPNETHLEAFDECLDFGGAAGASFQLGPATAETQVALGTPLSPVCRSMFVGEGSIEFNVWSIGQSFAMDQAGGIITVFRQTSGVRIAVCYTYELSCNAPATVDFTQTDWIEQVTIERFDPELGVLVGVRISLDAEIRGSIAYENLDPTTQIATVLFSADFTLESPGGLPWGVATAAVTIPSITTPAFDGSVDFAGPSGATFSPLEAVESVTLELHSTEDLAPFVGSPGNPGSITFSLGAREISFVSGLSAVAVQSFQEGSASIEVCYERVEGSDCNGNNTPDDQDLDANGNGVPDDCEEGSFCFGNGSGSGCPCGNDSPFADEGCIHSAGQGMRIVRSGSSSISADDLSMIVHQCPPGNAGVFFSGTDFLDMDSPGMPLFDGLLCAGGEVRRFQPQFQISGSAADTDFVLQASSGYFSAGSFYYFQYWTRDVARGTSPCRGYANLSPAYSIQMTP